jgi:hypothetical protein
VQADCDDHLHSAYDVHHLLMQKQKQGEKQISYKIPTIEFVAHITKYFFINNISLFVYKDRDMHKDQCLHN